MEQRFSPVLDQILSGQAPAGLLCFKAGLYAIGPIPHAFGWGLGEGLAQCLGVPGPGVPGCGVTAPERQLSGCGVPERGVLGRGVEL